MARLVYSSADANARIRSIARRGPMYAKIQTLFKPPATAAGLSGCGPTAPSRSIIGRVAYKREETR